MKWRQKWLKWKKKLKIVSKIEERYFIKGVRKREDFHTIHGNVNYGSYCGKYHRIL
jgi:hypothetical protein